MSANAKAIQSLTRFSGHQVIRLCYPGRRTSGFPHALSKPDNLDTNGKW